MSEQRERTLFTLNADGQPPTSRTYLPQTAKSPSADGPSATRCPRSMHSNRRMRTELAALDCDALYCMYEQYRPAAVKPTRVGRDPRATPTSTRASVAIGFGSPSGDSGVTRLDLNDILVRHPQATFLMRIAGGAMRDSGIDDAALVLIDRAITPGNGHVVIAVVGDEFVCRRLSRQGNDLRLCADQDGVADIVAADGNEFQIWGVVTQVIKTMPV